MWNRDGMNDSVLGHLAFKSSSLRSKTISVDFYIKGAFARLGISVAWVQKVWVGDRFLIGIVLYEVFRCPHRFFYSSNPSRLRIVSCACRTLFVEIYHLWIMSSSMHISPLRFIRLIAGGPKCDKMDG